VRPSRMPVPSAMRLRPAARALCHPDSRVALARRPQPRRRLSFLRGGQGEEAGGPAPGGGVMTTPTTERAAPTQGEGVNPQAGGASMRVDDPILQVRDLVKHFPVKAGLLRRTVAQVHAVCGLSFDVGRGETLGLVGESGCGKSTTGRLLLRLLPATHGSVRFRGKDLLELSAGEMRAQRRDLQIVFQDPYASLNPRMTVYSIIAE